MNDLNIEQSYKTPLIKFLSTGILRIEGRSIPENPIEFYKEVLNWLNEYKNSTPTNTELHIDLEYYNSSSSIILLNILKTLKSISLLGCDVKVHWHNSYNDDEMIESGRYYENIVKIPFVYYELN